MSSYVTNPIVKQFIDQTVAAENDPDLYAKRVENISLLFSAHLSMKTPDRLNSVRAVLKAGIYGYPVLKSGLYVARQIWNKKRNHQAYAPLIMVLCNDLARASYHARSARYFRQSIDFMKEIVARYPSLKETVDYRQSLGQLVKESPNTRWGEILNGRYEPSYPFSATVPSKPPQEAQRPAPRYPMTFTSKRL